MMQFIRQYVTPAIVVIIFIIALVAVSARIFLPSDMLSPAPVDEHGPQKPMTDAFTPNDEPS